MRYWPRSAGGTPRPAAIRMRHGARRKRSTSCAGAHRPPGDARGRQLRTPARRRGPTRRHAAGRLPAAGCARDQPRTACDHRRGARRCLAPLPVPVLGSTVEQALASAAVQLFADRGAAARPEFGIDEATVDDSVERSCAGSTACRSRSSWRRPGCARLPVHEVAARLSDQFRLLTGGSRTALPRHRTLRAVVEWSWDLLAPAEWLLAERLAVFPAGRYHSQRGRRVRADDRGAPHRHSRPAGRPRRQVAPLCWRTTGPRYRMLETIREFGIDRLAERGEVDCSADRSCPVLRGPDHRRGAAAARPAAASGHAGHS